MPRGRKRKDPGEAPVDGDYALDQVLDKQKGFDYALVHLDDLPRMKSRGYVDVERGGEDPAHPAFDIGSDRLYEVGANGLRLMKVRSERYKAIHGAAMAQANARLQQIRKTAARGDSARNISGGGEFAQQVET
jgi:hypothetical protein